MKKKKIFVMFMVSMFIMSVFLGGCQGVSQEDYDKVTAERDKLKKDYDKVVEERDLLKGACEGLKRISEVRARVARSEAKMEAEYVHAKFFLYIWGKAAGMDVSTAVNDLEVLHNTATENFAKVNERLEAEETLGLMESDEYEERIKLLDDVDKSWGEYFQTYIEMENKMLNQ